MTDIKDQLIQQLLEKNLKLEAELKEATAPREAETITTVIGLPTIVRLLLGKDCHLSDVHLIPDDVLHNQREEVRLVANQEQFYKSFCSESDSETCCLSEKDIE